MAQTLWNQLFKIDNYKILSKSSSLWYKNSARFKWKSYCCLISYDCHTQSLWPASIDGYTIRIFARKEESHGTFSMYLSCQTTHNPLLGNLWIVILIFPLMRGNYPGMFSAVCSSNQSFTANKLWSQFFCLFTLFDYSIFLFSATNPLARCKVSIVPYRKDT